MKRFLSHDEVMPGQEVELLRRSRMSDANVSSVPATFRFRTVNEITFDIEGWLEWFTLHSGGDVRDVDGHIWAIWGEARANPVYRIPDATAGRFRGRSVATHG